MWNDEDIRIQNIYNMVCIDKQTVPLSCPICGKLHAHFFIYRHDETHGGLWLWCSFCKSYTHGSMFIPDWWKNPDFIDSSLLMHNPDYLEKNAERIDDWVNTLIIELRNKKIKLYDLIRIGYYSEMPHGEQSDPSIKDRIGKLENVEFKDNICNYLESGIPIAVCCEKYDDIIDPKKGFAGFPHVMTDGKYYWPNDLSYYIKNYNLGLDNDFLLTMMSNNWKIPISEENLDFSSTLIDGDPIV